jgi:hypothetical protein
MSASALAVWKTSSDFCSAPEDSLGAAFDHYLTALCTRPMVRNDLTCVILSDAFVSA